MADGPSSSTPPSSPPTPSTPATAALDASDPAELAEPREPANPPELLTHCTRPVHEDDPPAEIYKLQGDDNWYINRDGILPSKRLYTRAPYEYYTDPDPLEEGVDAPIDVVFVSSSTGENYITVDKCKCVDISCPLPHCFPNMSATRPRPIRISARAELFAKLPEMVNVEITQIVKSTERVGNLADEVKQLDRIAIPSYRFGDATADVIVLPYPMTTTSSPKLGIVNMSELQVWESSNYWSAATHTLVSAGDVYLAYSTLSSDTVVRNQILTMLSIVNGGQPSSDTFEIVGSTYRKYLELSYPQTGQRATKPKAVPTLQSVTNNRRIQSARAVPTISKQPNASGTRVWGSDDRSAAFELTVSFNEMIEQLEAAKRDRDEANSEKTESTETAETVLDLVERLRWRLLRAKQTNNVVLLDALLLSEPTGLPRMLGRYVVSPKEGSNDPEVREWLAMNEKDRKDFLNAISLEIRNQEVSDNEMDDLSDAPDQPVVSGSSIPISDSASPTISTCKVPMETCAVSSQNASSLDTMPRQAPTGGWVQDNTGIDQSIDINPSRKWDYRYTGNRQMLIQYDRLRENALDNSVTELQYKIVGDGAEVNLTTTRHASLSASDHYLSKISEIKNLVAVMTMFEIKLFEDYKDQKVPKAKSTTWAESLSKWSTSFNPFDSRVFGRQMAKQLKRDYRFMDKFDANKVLRADSDIANIPLVLADMKSNFEALISPRSDPLKGNIVALMSDYTPLFPSSWPLKGATPVKFDKKDIDDLNIIRSTSVESSKRIKTAHYSFPSNYYTPSKDDYTDVFECLSTKLDVDIKLVVTWLRDLPPEDSLAQKAWKNGSSLEIRAITTEESNNFRQDYDKNDGRGIDLYAKMHVAVTVLKDLNGSEGLITANDALLWLANQIDVKRDTLYSPPGLNWLLRATAYVTNKPILLWSTKTLLFDQTLASSFVGTTVSDKFVRLAVYNPENGIDGPKMARIQPMRKLIRRIATVAVTKLPTIELKNAHVTTTQDIGESFDKVDRGSWIAPVVGEVFKLGLRTYVVPKALKFLTEAAQSNVAAAAVGKIMAGGWATAFQSFNVPSRSIAGVFGQGAAVFLGASLGVTGAVTSAVGLATGVVTGSVFAVTVLSTVAFTGAITALDVGGYAMATWAYDSMRYFAGFDRLAENAAAAAQSADWGFVVLGDLIKTAYLGKSDAEVQASVQRMTTSLLFNVSESLAEASKVAIVTKFNADINRRKVEQESRILLRGEPIISCVARMRVALKASQSVDNAVSKMGVQLQDVHNITRSITDVSLNFDVGNRIYMDELWEYSPQKFGANVNDTVISLPLAPFSGFFVSSIPPKVIRMETEDALQNRGFYNLGETVGVDSDDFLDGKLAVRELSDAVHRSRIGSYYEALRSVHNALAERILKQVVTIIKTVYNVKVKFALEPNDMLWQQIRCGPAALLMLRHAPVNAHAVPTSTIRKALMLFAMRLAKLDEMPPMTSGVLTSQIKSIARMQVLSSRGPRFLLNSNIQLSEKMTKSEYLYLLDAKQSELPIPTIVMEDPKTQRATFASRRLNRRLITDQLNLLGEYKLGSIDELIDNLASLDDGALFYHSFGSPLRLTPTRGSIGDRVISIPHLLWYLQNDTDIPLSSNMNAVVKNNTTTSGMARHPYVLSVQRSTSNVAEIISIFVRILNPDVITAPPPETSLIINEKRSSLADLTGINDMMNAWDVIVQELFNVDRILTAIALIRSSGESSATLEFDHSRAQLWVAIASQMAEADGFSVRAFSRKSETVNLWITSLLKAPPRMRLIEVLASL